MIVDIIIIFLLIALNGLFAMAELAIVSARRGRLLAKVDEGSHRAKIALTLKDNPATLLSTIQIGITSIGILSGMYSGSTIAEPFGEFLSGFSFLARHGDDVAVAIVVTVVTFASLIIGELVPKQIALHHADRIALLSARPLMLLSTFSKPLVAFLNATNHAVLTLLGIKENEAATTNEEDVKAVIAEGQATGALDKQEQRMLENVLRLDAIPVRATMTHRQDITFFNIGEAKESILAKIRDVQHSHYPLCDDKGAVAGTVSLKYLISHICMPGDPDLKSIATKTLTLSESATVREALDRFRKTKVHTAILVDEYGSLEGIITLKDILEAIVGMMPEQMDQNSFSIVKRKDGSWLVDGLMPLFELEGRLGIKKMQDESGAYTTLAGFVLHHLRQLPSTGDLLEWEGYLFEIVDMDANRIDKLLIKKQEITGT
ncbi:MAG: hemolysin family protein [Rickettsiales bacterium]